MYLRLIPALLLGGALLPACGNSPTYELHWTLGCDDGLGPCEVSSARDCSRVGVGQIEVETRQGNDTTRAVFLCFSAAEGPLGRGPGLGSGPVELTVWPLSPVGQRIAVEPGETSGEIPSEGVVQLTVDVPIAPACADTVDNDGDGHVDRFDPGCTSDDDTDETE